MEEKLLNLYNECIQELNTIGIDILNPIVGKIDIKLSARSNKRYGCCIQEEPDKSYVVKKKIGRKIILKCEKFNVHHIQISKWVMKLNDEIVKNTIIHELIHCLPYCNNHAEQFKKYAKIINTKLGYNITTKGNKELDYKKSNIEYTNEIQNYKYKIQCEKCGQIFYRQRLNKNFVQKYRCGKCNGKLKMYQN